MREQILTDDQLDSVSGGEIKLIHETPHASSTSGTTKPPRGPLKDVGVEGAIW